jgi:hypothetical protein
MIFIPVELSPAEGIALSIVLLALIAGMLWGIRR